MRSLILILLLLSQAAMAQRSQRPSPYDVSSVIAQLLHLREHGAEVPPLFPPEDRSQVSVGKVVTRQAMIFSGDVSGGHGTGFVVGFDAQGRALMFTNRHVIERSLLNAQQITVEFPTSTNMPEVVNAELIYQSSVNDFAVLRFAVDMLRRVNVVPVGLPNARSPDEAPWLNFSQNFRRLVTRPVFAIGNPFDGENIITQGSVSGRHQDPVNGDYIQTQTPINPGNSGGPLLTQIEVQGPDGQPQTRQFVVGINTAKLLGADNTGFAIPIGVLMDEFVTWQTNRGAIGNNVLLAGFGMVPAQELRALNLQGAIQGVRQDYFNHFSGALRVMDADPSTNLQSGDIVLTLNNQFLGNSIYNYKLAMQRLGRTAQNVNMTVIRQGQVMTVISPVINYSLGELRTEVDYVMISGLLFGRVSPFGRFTTGARESGVYIYANIGSQEANFRQFRFPPSPSLLVAVEIDNQRYETRSLADLRRLVETHTRAQTMRLFVREPVSIATDEGVMPVPDMRFGTPTFRPTMTNYVIPVTEVLTPSRFNIAQQLRRFSFAQEDVASRDWRRHVIPADAENACRPKFKAPGEL